MIGRLTMSQNVVTTSAEPVRKPTGAQTPADALGVTKRMSTSNEDGNQSGDVECPTCGGLFATTGGMKSHHTQIHGESIAGIPCTCEWCGDKFRVKENMAEERRFCSSECFGDWRGEEMVGVNCPGYKEKVTLSCRWCDSEFVTFPSRKEVRQFCSFECKGEWQSVNISGEDHPQWQPDTEEISYKGGWYSQRRRCLERDSRKCQGCGMGWDKHLEENGQGLHVHHITPYRSFDDPCDANELDNLITLCQSCHWKWEGTPLRPELID